MDNCCDSFLKYVICLCNFLLFISGAGLIAMGAYVHITMTEFADFLGQGYFTTSIFMMVLGVVILCLGFCGCCGAVTESACLMFTFATFLALIVLIEVHSTR